MPIASDIPDQGSIDHENAAADGIEAIVFDCDGTLVNSMDYFFTGWEAVCARYELTFSRTRFFELAGRPIRDMVDTIMEENKVCGAGAQAFEEEKQLGSRDAFIEKFLEEKFAIVEGQRAKGIYPSEVTTVTNFVRANYGKIPLAVASSGDRKHVHADLERCDLKKYFDAVVTCEDVKNGKPAPDLFEEAAKRLGVAPSKCRGYEDADLGLESLRRAGFASAVDVRKLEGYPT